MAQPFNYSINTPNSENTKCEEDERNSFEIINKYQAVDRTPVVILLGWAGCQEKHLAKYSLIYQKKGLITLTFIVPPRKLFLQTRELSGIAQGLMDVLVKNNFIDNHIVFHVFSNGGCLVYTQLIHLLNMPDSPFRDRLHVRGVIFDSAPGKKRILQATKAFMLTVQANVVIRFILGFFLLVYLMIMQVVSKLVPGRGFLLYKNVMEDPTSCPQLFLYSKADKIILSEDVEEMITARKERGFDVKSICWDDSEHVSHFRSHPEIYTKTCQEFVASCLDSQL